MKCEDDKIGDEIEKIIKKGKEVLKKVSEDDKMNMYEKMNGMKDKNSRIEEIIRER